MKKCLLLFIGLISFLFFGCASLNTTNKPEDYYSENYRRYRTENRTISDLCKISETFYSYLLSSEIQFDTDIYDIPVAFEVYQKWNIRKEEFVNKTSPFIRDVSILKHSLGIGKPGSDEYILYKTEKLTLSFISNEDKKSLAKMIEEEYVFRQKQKERIAENKRLNPNNYDYQDLPVISMATMGVAYAPNPNLIPGKVYIADQLRRFYIINSMGNEEYNIGQESNVYGMYQFIMKNSSGEGLGGIGGHMFADTAYLRYLGTKKVIMSNGYERWLPYYEMLKINPHESKIVKIIRECSKW